MRNFQDCTQICKISKTVTYYFCGILYITYYLYHLHSHLYARIYKSAQRSSNYGKQLRIIQHDTINHVLLLHVYGVVSTIRDKNCNSNEFTSRETTNEHGVCLWRSRSTYLCWTKRREVLAWSQGSTIAKIRSTARRVPRPSVNPTTVDQSVYSYPSYFGYDKNLRRSKYTSQSTSVYDFV